MRGIPRTAIGLGPARLTVLLVLTLLLGSTGCGGPTDQPTTETYPPPATVDVPVYLSNGPDMLDCAAVAPVTRTVDADDPVTGALEALLAGPTPAEVEAGFTSWFTDATERMLLAVNVDAAGTAYVVFADLRPVIPNVSTSCGSAALLAQLDTTLLAFDHIQDTRYALADQPAFYEWLQLDDPGATPPAAPPTEHPQPSDTASADRPGQEDPATADDVDAADRSVDLDVGWSLLSDFRWPVTPQCCASPITGPASPAGPLPTTGWPTDGFYDVTVVRPSTAPTSLVLTIRKWLHLEEVPEIWEGSADVLVSDPDDVIERTVPVEDIEVVAVPIGVPALLGEPGAFARLLTDGIDPAFRRWVQEPVLDGSSPQEIRAELLERSADPTFPFGQDYTDAEHYGVLAYRAPLGSRFRADPTWLSEEGLRRVPPGLNGLYDWNAVTLEVRDSRPVLYLWTGEIAG